MATNYQGRMEYHYVKQPAENRNKDFTTLDPLSQMTFLLILLAPFAWIRL